MTVILLFEDGHAMHDGIKYADLETALDVLKPHDFIVSDVIDCSKPCNKDSIL